MYTIMIGIFPLPIAPARIEYRKNSRNETLDLIDGSEVTVLKKSSLEEISFEFRLPYGDALGAVQNEAILAYLDTLIGGGVSSVLTIVRMTSDYGLKTMLQKVSWDVTLESLSVTEDASELGNDVLVGVTFREYKAPSSRFFLNGQIVKTRP